MHQTLHERLRPLRHDFRSNAEQAADAGPFVCFGLVPKDTSLNALEAIDAEADALAQRCVWPDTWFSRPGASERWQLQSQDGKRLFVWVVELARRGEAFGKLARQAAARLPERDRPPNLTEPAGAWLLFVLDRLRAAGLTREADAQDGRAKLWWHEADAFGASVAAIDTLAEDGPAAGDWFCWDAEKYDLSHAPLQWRLLHALWPPGTSRSPARAAARRPGADTSPAARPCPR